MKTYIIGNLLNFKTFSYIKKNNAVLLEVQKCKTQLKNLKIKNDNLKKQSSFKTICFNIINITACCEINSDNLSRTLIHSKIREPNFDLSNLKDTISFIIIPDIRNKNRERLIFEAENDKDAINYFKNVIKNLDPIKYKELKKDMDRYKGFRSYTPIIKFKPIKNQGEKIFCFGKNFELKNKLNEKIKIKEMLNNFYGFYSYSNNQDGIEINLNEFFSSTFSHDSTFGINSTIFEKIEFYLSHCDLQPETFIKIDEALKKFINESGYFKKPYKGMFLSRRTLLDIDSFMKNELLVPIICITKNDCKLIENDYFYNDNLEEFLLDSSLFVLECSQSEKSYKNGSITTANLTSWRINENKIQFIEIKNGKKYYITLDIYGLYQFRNYLNENLYIKSPINGKLLNLKKILIESEKTNGKTVY